MKSAIICKTTQFRLANLDGQDPSLRMQKHLQGCDRCGEFREKLARLSSALRASADSAPTPAVLPDASNASLGRASWLPRFAFVSVAVMAGGLLYWSQDRGSEPTTATDEIARLDTTAAEAGALVHQPGVTKESESDVGAEQSASDSLLSKQLANIGILQSVTPMEEELDALRSDGARGLSRLLALGQRATPDPQ